MPLTDLQKRTVEAIVNVFETGSVRGDYANITLIRGDTGGLTYGRSQTTINSGNLYKLLVGYAAIKGADGRGGEYSARIAEYLPRVKAKDAGLASDARFRRLLKLAGQDDPLMRRAQDEFFDAVYFAPALVAARRRGIVTPLGIAVVYDSTVHGSWQRIAERVDRGFGAVAKIGEPEWVWWYVQTRDSWLRHHSRADLRNCVYRTEAFARLVRAANWSLTLPVMAHGVTITALRLNAP